MARWPGIVGSQICCFAGVTTAQRARWIHIPDVLVEFKGSSVVWGAWESACPAQD